MKIKRGLGTLLLAIWLIVTGVLQFVPIVIPGITFIMAILAIAAGILLLLGK